MARITIIGEMADGTVLVEHVVGWDAFVAVALPLWNDGECLRVTWHPTPPPPAALRRPGAAAA